MLLVHVQHYFTDVRIHNLHQCARLRLGDLHDAQPTGSAFLPF